MDVGGQAVDERLARLVHPRLALARERLHVRARYRSLGGQLLAGSPSMSFESLALGLRRPSRLRESPSRTTPAARPLEFCRAPMIARRVCEGKRGRGDE